MDTHSEVHVAAALDPVGRAARDAGVARDSVRYASQPGWLGKFGDVTLVGVEGAGSCGAGLARYLGARGVRVVEGGRAELQDRHRNGKSGPLDAVSAARAALSGRQPGCRKAMTGR